MRILIGALAAFTPQALGQVPPTSGFCDASVDAPTIMASEGVAELAGDFMIKCQGGTPTWVYGAKVI